MTDFQKRTWPVYTADLVALLGLLVFFIQAIVFAHTTISNLDEGAYLLKGFLFATGQYHPFEPGISTNKSPLAFLIPGYVQLLFGPGLRTGRYLAVFFGMMAVVGTWAVSRRIGGKWLAAGAVWVFACSPAIIKIYTGSTQSTIACMLVWALALCLGEKRSHWQLILSGVLAGAMMMVRQNMLPVLPLLAVYAFWQHGWKALGLLISGLVVVISFHVAYWPDIVRLWDWIPLFKIPVALQYTGGGTPIWNPEISTLSRVLSIFQAVRFHFIALVGSVVSLLFWPKFSNWKSNTDFRMAVFLLALFWGLVVMHSLAAIGMDYCVFCLTPYIAFFNVAGILFLVVSVKSWNRTPSAFVQTLFVVIMLIMFTGIGFSAFEDIGASLLKLPAPRMRDMRILPGFVTWGEILSNRFHMVPRVAMQYLSGIFGLLIGGLVLFIGFMIWRFSRLRKGLNFGAFIAPLVLVTGLVLSPVLHGSQGARDCRTDVILANEQIGEYLRDIIPQGSLVYWDGGLSAAPFLYLPGVHIFPPQINDGYSFISNGDTAQLYEIGFWNEEMDSEWKTTADFFIIEGWRYKNGWREFFTPERFDEFERTSIGTSCSEESYLRIFRRK